MLSRSEDRSVTIDVGDQNHEIGPLYECLERGRAPTGGVAAVKFEGMTFAGGRSRIALLASLYASDKSDVHR
jgi:hypothetical protein